MQTSTLKTALARLWQTAPPRGGDLGDAELLERFRVQREEAAFTLLVQRHGPMVLGVCRRLLGDDHDAEDAFQATFLVLVRRAGAIRNQASVAGFLYGVACRIARKARTQSARRRAHEREVRPLMLPPTAPEVLTVSELHAVLAEEIERLPPRQREPLLLCYLQGKTHAEAARLLGWPKSSVTARLERARQLLQRRLARRGFTVPAGLLAALLAEQTANAAVPAVLTLATVRLATQVLTGQALTATAAAALADGVAMGSATSRIAALLTLLLTVGVATGIGLLALPGEKSTGTAPQPVSRHAEQPKHQPEPAPRRDLLGDPLPEGALARLGSGRLRHGAPVNALAFTPDRKVLVSAGEQRLRAWDAATGKLRWQTACRSWFFSLAFSADGTMLIWAGDDQAEACRFLDVASGKERRRLDLKPPIARPARLTLSPDGKRLAVNRQPDNSLRLYDTATGKEALRIKTAGPSSEVAFAPDGKTLALTDQGDTIHLHDATTGELIGECQRKAAQFVQPTFAPDGRSLAVNSLGRDGGISIWDAAARKEQHRFKPDGWYFPFTFSPDGKLLAMGGTKSFSLWDAATGKEVYRREVSPSKLAFRPDGEVLATACTGTITLWDVATGRPLPSSPTPIFPVGQLRFIGGGKQVVGVAEEVLTWDAATGREVRRLACTGQPFNAALSRDGTRLATGEPNGPIQLWDLTSGKRGCLIAPAEEKSFLLQWCFSPDGRRLHAVHVNAAKQPLVVTIRTWDASTGREVGKLTSSGRMANLLIASPDGRWLASGSTVFDRNYDNAIRLWDLTTGREARHIPAVSAPPCALAFSPDSKRLAAAGSSEAGVQAGRPDAPALIRIWDVASGEAWRTLTGPKQMATCLAFSPDGRMLATGGDDRIMTLWELASGRQRWRFQGHEGALGNPAFAPDGRRLATSSSDALAYVWDVTGSVGRARRALPAAELDRCWTDLAGEDAVAAFRAVRRLAASPAEAVPFLRERLRPVPVADPQRIRQLVAALDSPQYAERRKAIAELEERADAAASLLHKAMRDASSLYVRRTLQQVLERSENDGAALRAARAVEALEWMATPAATRLLTDLAAGAADARLTREATAARDRLRRLGAPPR